MSGGSQQQGGETSTLRYFRSCPPADPKLPTTVSLDSLSAQQLTQVKKQLDEEVEHLTTSFAQLQSAQIKFRDCLRCVKVQGTTPGEQLRSWGVDHVVWKGQLQRNLVVTTFRSGC